MYSCIWTFNEFQLKGSCSPYILTLDKLDLYFTYDDTTNLPSFSNTQAEIRNCYEFGDKLWMNL